MSYGSVSDADVLALLVTGEYVSSEAIGKELGITRNAVWKHVKNLRALGWNIYATPRRGMLLVDEKPDPAPGGWQAPAPATPPPERPADEAPAPASLPPQVGLAPFAGVAASGWIDPDDEIGALEVCASRLGRLDAPARDRVMTYLASRFVADWPDEKET